MTARSWKDVVESVEDTSVPTTEYEFSNGRKFKDGGKRDTSRGVYSITVEDGAVVSE